MANRSKVHEEVRRHYGDFARANARASKSRCCPAQNTLYPAETLRDLPADIAGFTAGNGDPVTPANLQAGEIVLDLGSGGGLDCFLAARQVGETGHVIGVDMTPEMLARARENAGRLGVKNVEFREGFLESLPVADDSVDVVISNCVINLAPDKAQVFREVFRVLKPGGRVSLSDSVTNRPVPKELRENRGEWCGCTSGALPYDQYVTELKRAGFVDVRLEPNVELVKQAIQDGTVKVDGEVTDERLRDTLRNWEKCDTNMFVPHLIFACKPA
jgi:arsenite methyltransferase